MASSGKRAHLGLVMILWLVTMFVLWAPGIGTVSVPHLHYVKINYGVLGYYVNEVRDGKTVRSGVQDVNLAFTIILTTIISTASLFDVYQ